jgi:hypothetical protein
MILPDMRSEFEPVQLRGRTGRNAKESELAAEYDNLEKKAVITEITDPRSLL